MSFQKIELYYPHFALIQMYCHSMLLYYCIHCYFVNIHIGLLSSLSEIYFKTTTSLEYTLLKQTFKEVQSQIKAWHLS